jgi:hypothetical protein
MADTPASITPASPRDRARVAEPRQARLRHALDHPRHLDAGVTRLKRPSCTSCRSAYRVLELVGRLGLAVSRIDPYLALAPLTNEELIESAKRVDPTARGGVNALW